MMDWFDPIDRDTHTHTETETETERVGTFLFFFRLPSVLESENMATNFATSRALIKL